MPFRHHASDEVFKASGIDEYLVQNPDAAFILRATGDSMKEAGIMPEDLVVVERGKIPKPGDIVLLYSDGSYTLKYFDEIRRSIARGEFQIEAVVTGLIRSYR